MSRGKFWMVIGAGRPGGPTFRHPTKQSAKNEAERLARSNPGDEFTVLESLATVVRSEVQWEMNDLDGSEPDDEVPF